MIEQPGKAVEILLVEDNPGDARLVQVALQENHITNNLQIVSDGEKGLACLRKIPPYEDAATPGLILLDLNMPRMDGREFLGIIKSDPELKRIPVVVMTTSSAEKDILESYELRANAYVTKPLDLDQFFSLVQEVEDFWFSVVELPQNDS
jgi:two-component system, chemotaxis family, response regulator Rcp1